MEKPKPAKSHNLKTFPRHRPTILWPATHFCGSLQPQPALLEQQLHTNSYQNPQP